MTSWQISDLQDERWRDERKSCKVWYEPPSVGGCQFISDAFTWPDPRSEKTVWARIWTVLSFPGSWHLAEKLSQFTSYLGISFSLHFKAGRFLKFLATKEIWLKYVEMVKCQFLKGYLSLIKCISQSVVILKSKVVNCPCIRPVSFIKQKFILL